MVYSQDTSTSLVVIPSRLAAQRLPGKPLLMIGDTPMIVHVWRIAQAAQCGPVVVACGDQEIADAITAAGGTAVMTDPALASGTDRVHAAAEAFDPEGRFKTVINVQGDLPTLDSEVIRAINNLLKASERFPITTAASKITTDDERNSDAVVKIALSLDPSQKTGEGLYFSRSLIPNGPGPHYHHIGVYGFHREALRTFVSLPPSPLEQQERLEQLRAREAGMAIGVTLVPHAPRGVDTPEDLARIRAIFAAGA